MPSNQSKHGTLIVLVGTIALLALYVAHAVAVDYVVDDAYISFHYARHFAQGNGLVYNVGERVEGYTNFLWVVLIAAALKLMPTIDPLLIARALSLLSGAGCIVLCVWFSARRLRHGPWLSLTAGLVLAANSSFCAWSMGGLESTLVSFLWLLTVILLDREFRRGAGVFWPALTAGLACLVRADGFVLFAILTVARFCEGWRRGEKWFNRRHFAWCAVFLLVMGPFVAWRMWYYGEPLPNTAYAKVGFTVDQLIRGFRQTKHFAENYGGALLVPLCLLPWIRRQGEPWGRIALWVLAGWTAYIFKVGGDGLAWFRFFGFVMPLIAMLAQEGLATLIAWASTFSLDIARWRLRAVTTAMAVALAALGAQQSNEVLRHSDPEIHPYHHFDNYFVDRCAAAGRWFKENTPPDAVVASTPAGALAYFSERSVIDMLGLTDRHIARVPIPTAGRGRAGHEKGDGAYVLSRKPDYILIGNVAVGRTPLSEEQMKRDLCQRSENELWALHEFHREYELRSVRLNEEGPFQYFSFYKRRP